MKKHLLLTLICLMAVPVLFAQPVGMRPANVDSLNRLLTSKIQDSSKVHVLYWLSRAHTLSNNVKSLELANEGLDLARKINFPLGQIECLEALSFSYAISSAFEKGFKAAYEQIELSRKYAPIREVFGINMMGLLYQKLGDDKESLNWAKKAYFHPKLKETDNFTQWSAMFLLAQEYERMDKLDSANHYAQETLDYSKAFFPMQQGYPTMILARINSKRKNFDAAVNYCKQSIGNSQNSKSDFFVNEVQNELAQIYFAQNKLDSAQIYANIALQGANQFKNYLVIMNSSYLLSQIFEKKDPVKAYEFLKVSIAAKDTVKNIEKNKQIKQLEIKEQQRIDDLNLAGVYAKNELRFNTVMVLLGSTLLISLILFRNNRQKQKANLNLKDKNDKIEKTVSELKTTQVSLASRNAENELLLKEIHHRVKNNLEVVSSLLALQSAKIEDPEIQDAMLASQNRVQSMGILHQKLYQSEHLAFIEMKNYFENLCENILDSYNETERIKVDIDMKEVELDIDTAVPVGLIVNELLTNSLKYAFPKGEKGNIKVSLENLDKEHLSLKISDNGVGKIVDMKAKGTGFGTQLVDLLTKQIEGTIHQEVNNGTMISIQFKRQSAA